MGVVTAVGRGLNHDSHVGVEGNERRTHVVVVLTLVVMVAEVLVGRWTGSLALTADGWHMATHAGALALSAVAYWFARAWANRGVFAFGTGKVFALAGFSSAILLGVAALWMGVEAVVRLVAPTPVQFAEALPVAVLGLVVNIVSVGVLHRSSPKSPSGHDHAGHGHSGHDHAGHDHAGHDHSGHAHAGHAHGGHGHDHNLRAVYLHVIADALTSVLAIVALVCGRTFGWVALDPIMAIVGGIMILRWSIGLGRVAAAQLVDATTEPEIELRVRQAIIGLGANEVVDLHTWRTGPRHRTCVVTVRCLASTTSKELRAAILATGVVDHLTVEVMDGDPA